MIYEEINIGCEYKTDGVKTLSRREAGLSIPISTNSSSDWQILLMQFYVNIFQSPVAALN